VRHAGSCGCSRRAGDVWRKLLERTSTLQAGWPGLIRRSHDHVNIFENFTALYGTAAVGSFNQIIARLSALLAPECIDEHERFGELLGFDQKTCAIDVPCAIRIHIVHPWGRESHLLLPVDRLASNSCTPLCAKD